MIILIRGVFYGVVDLHELQRRMVREGESKNLGGERLSLFEVLIPAFAW
jgi:hypothetical protein